MIVLPSDPKPFYVADLFCGAGGSSSGALQALKLRGFDMNLVAVNHWGRAIATHKKNHPHAAHYVEDVTAANPNEIVPGGYLDLLMASPECIFHSRARGGRPVTSQGRMSAWAVQRWCTALTVRTFLVENVPEFIDWGPLDEAGRPIKSKKGLYFQAWVTAIRELGYDFQWEYLNAADYGDATTRTRFFGIGRADGRRVMFPQPTHKRVEKGSRLVRGRQGKGPKAQPSLFDDGRLPWRAAREVIDWSLKGRSLLTDPKYKKTPLAQKTKERIARGLLKFNGPVLGGLLVQLLDLPAPTEQAAASSGLVPFVTVGRQNCLPRSVGEPLQTITTQPAMALVQPGADAFILPQRDTNAPRSVDGPLPTMVAVTRQGLVDGVAEPFVLGQQSGGAPRAAGEPLPTVTTDGAISVVVPVLTSYYKSARGGLHPVDEPVPTITVKDRFALVEPAAFVVSRHTNDLLRTPEEPLPTCTTRGAGMLVEPMLLNKHSGFNGTGAVARGVGEPVYSPTTEGAPALVEPMLLSQHADHDGAGGLPCRSVDDPAYCATTRGAGALVEPFITPGFGEREGQLPRVHSIDEPVPTVTATGVSRLVQPVISQGAFSHQAGDAGRSPEDPLFAVTTGAHFNLTRPALVQIAHTTDPLGHVHPVDEPLHTVTTRNNNGLATPVAAGVEEEGPALDPETPPLRLTVPADFDLRRLVVIDGTLYVLDIFFRMLRNPELAAAMGFDSDDLKYEFSGTATEVTKQIGNAVAVNSAKALVGAIVDSPPVAAESVEAAG